MKIEVTIERMKHGRWVKTATGKFTGEEPGGAEAMHDWLMSKGVPNDPTKAPGWAIRIAVT